MELNAKLETALTQSFAWFEASVWSFDTAIEFAVIIVALILGWLGRKFLRPYAISLIEKAKFPWRLDRILKNITKLIMHMIALILLTISVQVTALEVVDVSSIWLEVASKLLAAWVFIRVVAQFIANNFIRNIVASIAWIIAALSILGVLDDTMSILDALGFEIGDFRLSVLSITRSLIGVVLFVSLAMFLSNLIERRLSKSTDISITARVLVTKIIKFTLVSIAILIGITSAGIDLSILAVFGGALGLGIGFGLQKGVSNLFSGIILLLDRSIRPGDVIQLQEGGTFGWVEHMGARYTNIVTRDNKSYLVPNEDLITQQVVNWSHGNTLVRVEIEFGVHYDSDPHVVKKLATEAATKPARVVEEPKPVCHITEFGDSSVNFTLRFWIKDAQEGVTNVKGDVFLALWDSFKENKVQIPYPHREVFVHQSK